MAKKPSKSLVRKKPEASVEAAKTTDELFEQDFAQIEAELEAEETGAKSAKAPTAEKETAAPKAKATPEKASADVAGEPAEKSAPEETAGDEKAAEEKPAKKSRRDEKQEEHIFIVPLKVPRGMPSYKRAERSMRDLREFLSKHTKTPMEDVHIDASINNLIWTGGGKRVPARLRIRAVKFDDGVVEAEALAE